MIDSIWFDMDGTIADLYSVDNWLDKLHNEDVSPYVDAKPLVNMRDLENLLYAFQAVGVSVGVISWAAMDDELPYRKAVRRAKRAWLKKYCPILAANCHVVKYGTPKHSVPNKNAMVLVDDNNDVCKAWEHYGPTIKATPQILMQDLENLLWQVLNNAA